jgi:thiamine pyrophosphate-dependent acetolactate synthase large subunit-like protein
VVAADAHFRASGRIAAATSTYGAGFTNTLTALAESVQAHVPLVLVVGDEPTSGPRPGTSTRSRSPPASARALHRRPGGCRRDHGHRDRARPHLPRPVVLAIPYDVAALEAGEVPAAPHRACRAARAGEFAEGMLDRIADALRAAERSCSRARRLARRRGEALGALADATGRSRRRPRSAAASSPTSASTSA